jgi:hypothetical protein
LFVIVFVFVFVFVFFVVGYLCFLDNKNNEKKRVVNRNGIKSVNSSWIRQRQNKHCALPRSFSTLTHSVRECSEHALSSNHVFACCVLVEGLPIRRPVVQVYGSLHHSHEAFLA